MSKTSFLPPTVVNPNRLWAPALENNNRVLALWLISNSKRKMNNLTFLPKKEIGAHRRRLLLNFAPVTTNDTTVKLIRTKEYSNVNKIASRPSYR